jgi:hypothetical protein
VPKKPICICWYGGPNASQAPGDTLNESIGQWFLALDTVGWALFPELEPNWSEDPLDAPLDVCHDEALREDEALHIEGACCCPRCLAPLQPIEPPPLRMVREDRGRFHLRCTVGRGNGKQCWGFAISVENPRCGRYASPRSQG